MADKTEKKTEVVNKEDVTLKELKKLQTENDKLKNEVKSLTVDNKALTKRVDAQDKWANDEIQALKDQLAAVPEVPTHCVLFDGERYKIEYIHPAKDFMEEIKKRTIRDDQTCIAINRTGD